MVTRHGSPAGPLASGRRRGFAASALFSGCHSTPAPMTDRAPAVTPSIRSISDVVNRQVKEPTAFTLPPGNVRCYLDTTTARCDISERSWAPPLRPASCAFDYGHGITLRQGRPAEFICAGGDTAFVRAPNWETETRSPPGRCAAKAPRRGSHAATRTPGTGSSSRVRPITCSETRFSAALCPA